MVLSKEELNDISGGTAIKVKLYALGGLLTFLIGFFDGFTRPLRCN